MWQRGMLQRDELRSTSAPSPSPTVLVIANDEDDDLGVLGRCFADLGVGWRTIHRERFTEWNEPEPAPLLISLGSDHSVYAPHVAEPVAAEVGLIRAALDGGSSVLGVCFGGQLLAAALGGEVHPIERPEVGWCPVESVDPALVPSGHWAQWHFDGFTVPPGARLVAESPSGPQAFTFGQALGLQFHPEVDESIMMRWAQGPYSRAQLDSIGVDPNDLRQQCRDHAPANVERTRTLVGEFLRRSVAHSSLAPASAPMEVSS